MNTKLIDSGPFKLTIHLVDDETECAENLPSAAAERSGPAVQVRSLQPDPGA